MSKALMIYGASGYTGRLATRTAVQRGLQPVLAGRNGARIKRVAAEYQLPYRVFGLDDPAEAKTSLEGVAAVLHCAGPFSATARPMVDACLSTRTHYLDITGEIAVFEDVLGRAAEARQGRVCLVPGVGFDVVPSDCLAAMLAARLPDATQLELVIYGLGRTSPGTTKTMIEGLPDGGRERIDGEICVRPVARLQKRVSFSDGERTAYSIPWGDVSTAYHSTGIPNIVTYLVMPQLQAATLKVAGPLQAILRQGAVQATARRLAGLLIKGPDEAMRATAFCEIWGEVRNAKGRRVTGLVRTPEGYRFTVDAALKAAGHVIDGDVEPGAYTPSRAFGADFITECEGVALREFRSVAG